MECEFGKRARSWKINGRKCKINVGQGVREANARKLDFSNGWVDSSSKL